MSDDATGPAPSMRTIGGPAAAGREPGQWERMVAFRAAHPGVLVGGGDFGTWQALIPEANGETILVRYSLRELLDKLDEVLGEAPQ